MVETPDQATPLQNIRRAGWFLTFAGALVVLFALGLQVEHQLRLAAESGRATGRVADFILDPTRGKDVSYIPVIEFTTPTGAVQRFSTDSSWPGVADHVGQDVPIAYDPADPSQATIDDIRIVIYPLGGYGIIGLLLLLSGTWVLTRFTSWDESSTGLAA